MCRPGADSTHPHMHWPNAANKRYEAARGTAPRAATTSVQASIQEGRPPPHPPGHRIATLEAAKGGVFAQRAHSAGTARAQRQLLR